MPDQEQKRLLLNADVTKRTQEVSPCVACGTTERGRSACPLCGKVYCQNCAESPVSCCDGEDPDAERKPTAQPLFPLYRTVTHLCGHTVHYTPSRLADLGTPEYLAKFFCLPCSEQKEREQIQQEEERAILAHRSTGTPSEPARFPCEKAQETEKPESDPGGLQAYDQARTMRFRSINEDALREWREKLETIQGKLRFAVTFSTLGPIAEALNELESILVPLSKLERR